MATNQFITFWQFLQGQKIEIPIIQRDYAQGRKGKEKLREKFQSGFRQISTAENSARKGALPSRSFQTLHYLFN